MKHSSNGDETVMTRYNTVPFTETETETKKGTTLPRGRSFRGLPEELRVLAGEAYALWRDLAVERANPYGDHTGCLLAGRMAVDATRWEDGLTILAAIRARMDGKSSPRWIPEWAREAGGSKREQRRIAERTAAGVDPLTGRHIPGKEDIDPEVRRILVAFGRAKSKNMNVTTASWSCSVCKQLTDGRCAKCKSALHPKSCPNRHECAA